MKKKEAEKTEGTEAGGEDGRSEAPLGKGKKPKSAKKKAPVEWEAAS